MGKKYCSSSLCFNTFRSKNSAGLPIKFHRLSKTLNLQKEYKRIFKTDGFNWKYGYICCEHWSKGERESPDDLPDVPVPDSQYQTLKLKLTRAKDRKDKKNNKMNRLSYQKIKKKLQAADSILTLQNNQNKTKNKRRPKKSKVTNTIKKNDNLIMRMVMVMRTMFIMMIVMMMMMMMVRKMII